MALNWQDIQQNTFTQWCNHHLKDRGMHINDLKTDLRDGVLLVNLLEIISGKSLGRYNRNPRVPNQKYENNAIAIEFLKTENIKLVNVGSVDITDGNLRITLGLIWTLILRYQVNKGGDDGNAKNDLLKWVQSKIPEYNIKGFKGNDWNDGRALCALNNAIADGSCKNHRDLDPNNKVQNNQQGINLANDNLNIPRLISADALSHPKIDEQSVMAYISFFRDADLNRQKGLSDAAKRAAKCRAYGPGLVEAVAQEDAPFTVETPKGGGKLEVKVTGPQDNAQVKVNQKQNPDGTSTYDVSYKPKNPGNYEVSVTLDGVHIPGSVFKVRVLEAVSLGGEGKIRVFYSTTSSSDKGRSDVINLQRLLEAKQIHKRPDFEPWIAVDIMDKPDRDAVFKKAGTKALPIVFVDDKYVGDYDAVQNLEEVGKLDPLIHNMASKKR
eukprot:TRINITY_DN25809_c0_g1_i1.p1 TRINITY_DN25809_c0_g1~~TRINITY_DN25809_c0_g1_i1.p1  ORF type:complete len:439 (-),score=105.21 TRINITY_DN25809_c0_g1_i1:59-1375(-)